MISNITPAGKSATPIHRFRGDAISHFRVADVDNYFQLGVTLLVTQLAGAVRSGVTSGGN